MMAKFILVMMGIPGHCWRIKITWYKFSQTPLPYLTIGCVPNLAGKHPKSSLYVFSLVVGMTEIWLQHTNYKHSPVSWPSRSKQYRPISGWLLPIFQVDSIKTSYLCINQDLRGLENQAPQCNNTFEPHCMGCPCNLRRLGGYNIDYRWQIYLLLSWSPEKKQGNQNLYSRTQHFDEVPHFRVSEKISWFYLSYTGVSLHFNIYTYF